MELKLLKQIFLPKIKQEFIPALVSTIVGGMIGQRGQKSANTANIQQAEKQMAFQEAQNAKAMEFSADQANINRAFQERMSNTAYQRSMDDMREAGLNPMLAAMKGGASTPGGSAATGV